MPCQWFRVIALTAENAMLVRSVTPIYMDENGFGNIVMRAPYTSAMTADLLHRKFSGLLIVIGSLLFVFGGAFHPHINASMGALGSAEFFENFRMKILHHGSWERIHAMILAGPVLWLMGVPVFWRARNGWSRMAAAAMALAATLWSVTFVFDGFVASYIVRSIPADAGRNLLAANQDVVIRLGLISWLAMAFAMIAGGVGGLASNRMRSRTSLVLAWTGIALGLWPFIAWMTGLFLPGPFTSPYWNVSAVAVAFWFLAVGVFLLVPRSARVVSQRVHYLPAVGIEGQRLT